MRRIGIREFLLGRFLRIILAVHFAGSLLDDSPRCCGERGQLRLPGIILSVPPSIQQGLLLFGHSYVYVHGNEQHVHRLQWRHGQRVQLLQDRLRIAIGAVLLGLLLHDLIVHDFIIDRVRHKPLKQQR